MTTQNTSALFMHANYHQTHYPRSPSKQYIYLTQNPPVKTNRNASPYNEGRPNETYISPTYISGDCFYPHVKTPRPENRSRTPTRDAPSSPQPTLYDQYLTRQMHQRTQTQPVIRHQTPHTISIPNSVSIHHHTPSIRSQAPLTPQSHHQQRTKQKEGNFDAQSAYSTEKRGISSPMKEPSSDSKSVISQVVCPNCFNDDLVDEHKKHALISKIKDKSLLEHNLNHEYRVIHQEVEGEQLKKDIEKKLITSEFQAHLRRKEQVHEQQLARKERERQQDNLQCERLLNQKKQDYQDQVHKRMQFLRGIEEQLQERENQRQGERKRQQNYLQSLPNTLEIGEEYTHSGVAQQKQKQDIIQASLDQAIQDKARLKVVEAQRDQDYMQHLKRQDELDGQRAQFETLQRDIKRQQLNMGLDEQVKLKQERQKQHRERDLKAHYSTGMRTEQDPHNYQNCDGCDKQYIKEYLSKVRRPKSKLKRFQ